MVATTKPKPKPGEPKKKPVPKPQRSSGVPRIARTLPHEDYLLTHFDKHVNIKTRTIVLNTVYAGLGEDWESGTDAHMYERCLDAMMLLEDQDAKKPIKIIFSSYGGDYCYGLAIHDRIKCSPCPTSMYIYGTAMSMGAVISQAPNKLYVSKSVVMMLHFSHQSIAFRDKLGKTTADEHQRGDEYMLDLFVDSIRRRGKEIDREKLNQMMKDTLYLTAEQAVEMGLADGIITKP